MKKQKTVETSGAGQKRAAEEDLLVRMPTVGQVAEEERFKPLGRLVQAVKDTPVNEFVLSNNEAEENRALLKEKASDVLLWNSFVSACRVRAGEIERKRAHMASGEESPGKQRCGFSFVFSPSVRRIVSSWTQCRGREGRKW